MKFGPLPVAQAEGKILGHNVSDLDGKRLLRKGRQLTARDIKLLAGIGRSMVYVAELEPGDIDENLAAQRIAASICREGARLTGANVGRVNLLAEARSVLRVDACRLARVNECEGVTLATLPSHSVVQPRKLAATVKVIPFAVPETEVCRAEAIAAESGSILHFYHLKRRAVALILSSSPYAEARVTGDFVPALQQRIESLGSELRWVDFVPLEDEAGEVALAATIQNRREDGAQVIILAGETAIMDRYDIAPRAVERSGGVVTSYGAPVDPGNLLMLAYVGDVPVLGAPGCVRSPKTNIIDRVLPPLLAGDRLSRGDIIQMGHGGLLADIRNRPAPRQ
ncbi:MAG: molybdopterin-binding protein [Anaerolineales bacterium]